MSLARSVLTGLAFDLLAGLLLGTLVSFNPTATERFFDRLSRIWWVERLVRPRSPRPSLLAWVGALAGVAVGWRVSRGGASGVGLALFIVCPLLALILSICWIESPFRHSGGRSVDRRPGRRAPSN